MAPLCMAACRLRPDGKDRGSTGATQAYYPAHKPGQNIASINPGGISLNLDRIPPLNLGEISLPSSETEYPSHQSMPQGGESLLVSTDWLRMEEALPPKAPWPVV